MKTLLPVALACTLAVSACVENDQSMKILRLVAFTTSSCIADPAGVIGISGGIVDTLLVKDLQSRGQLVFGYMAAPVVSNGLVDRSAATGVQRDDLNLNGFDVELLSPSASLKLPLPATLRTSYHVAAAGGVIHPMMSGAAVAEVLPAAYAAALDKAVYADGTPVDRITVHMRPTATHDSGTLVGGSFDLQVRLCSGCLTATDPVKTPCGAGLPAGTILAGSCFPQQDSLVTCCLNDANVILCGSQVPIAK